MSPRRTPLIEELRRCFGAQRESWGRGHLSSARRLSLLSGVKQPRISEVLHGKRRRFSVADAARLTVATEIALELLLGLDDLVRVTCPACGWSVLARRTTAYHDQPGRRLARHW